MGTGAPSGCKLFKGVFAARKADECRDVVAAAPDDRCTCRVDIEIGGCLAGLRKAFQVPEFFQLFFKGLVRLLFVAGQHTIESDPFHPSLRCGLIAGVVYQNGNVKCFQLFLDLRRMVDHGVFNGKRTGSGINALKIRRRVFAGILDRSFGYGFAYGR